jgi:hypothetical protein
MSNVKEALTYGNWGYALLSSLIIDTIDGKNVLLTLESTVLENAFLKNVFGQILQELYYKLTYEDMSICAKSFKMGINSWIKEREKKLDDPERVQLYCSVSFYIQQIQGEQEDSDSSSSGLSDIGGEGDIYKKAVMIVRRDKKASISYVQRQLRIGYNRAATLIEKMENEGVVSPPNISGKREVIED